VDTKVTPEVELGATLGTGTDGVAVVRLEKNSPLARAGLQEGDRIRQVAGRNVLTPDSIYRILNEFDGGSTVELVVTRTGEELTYSLTLPDDHKRVLVEGVEPVPLASDREAEYLTRGDRDQGLLQRLRELERRQVIQQRQIEYLYRALVATRDQLGYPALSTAFPAFIGPGGTLDPETGENGTDGQTGTDDGAAPTGERPTQRRRVDVEDPDPDPPILEPRQPAPNRAPRQVPRANPVPRQPAPPQGNPVPRQ
jgi:membrane-associated protease RseP (regulator of RpoE activity)